MMEPIEYCVADGPSLDVAVVIIRFQTAKICALHVFIARFVAQRVLNKDEGLDADKD